MEPLCELAALTASEFCRVDASRGLLVFCKNCQTFHNGFIPPNCEYVRLEVEDYNRIIFWMMKPQFLQYQRPYLLNDATVDIKWIVLFYIAEYKQDRFKTDYFISF
jgi:hypothetical protein